ncbi:helix-turn-helix domain-containing protein [Kitasatospora sp. NPDC096147]|uniref:helix-turn-helix domain-containing protein n=1 Tax=Kitasatospora sp. NPDC096147 TaxID=3364093 RepID=UPI00382CEA46
MAVTELRRTELSDFLRTRRARITPEQVGLAPGVRRRTPGLRREELALLAGVGVTWYTWLEQGRRINPSPEVLGSLARTLRLDRAETDYLFRLAADPTVAAQDPAPDRLPAALTRLTTAQSPAPAFLMDADWAVRAWNTEADALFDFSRQAPADRNLAWLAFAHRPNRERTVDWEQHARRLLAQLRAAAGDRPALAATLTRLRDAFPEARRWLEEHQVSERTGTAKDLAHETAGLLRIDQLVLQAPDGFQLVVFSPRDEPTTARLRLLAGG